MSLCTWERRSPDAEILVVANMWPNEDRPHYGVFTARQVDSLIEREVHCDVLFVHGYRSKLAYVEGALRVLALNLRRRYAVVHSHGGECVLLGRCYLRAPLVSSFCGDDVLGTPDAAGRVSRRHRVRAALIRATSRLPRMVITKSAEMRDRLPHKVAAGTVVVPNGVDFALFAARPRDEARRMLGWRDDEVVALFAADPAVARKRHWLAEEAVHRAQARVPNLRLEVGFGVRPDEMPTYMSAADCLLLTSVHEGSPNVVKEAIAAGLPVVSTPVGDVRELLASVKPSWVCADDAAELAEALVRCAQRSGRSNGPTQRERLDLEQAAQRVRALYDEVR